jgi:hypothetical protein
MSISALDSRDVPFANVHIGSDVNMPLVTSAYRVEEKVLFVRVSQLDDIFLFL